MGKRWMRGELNEFVKSGLPKEVGGVRLVVILDGIPPTRLVGITT